MTTIVIDDDPKYQKPTIPALKNVKVHIQSREFSYKLAGAAIAKREAERSYDCYEFVECSKTVQESLSKEAYDMLRDQTFSAWDEKSKERAKMRSRALVCLALMLMRYLDITVEGSETSVDILK